MTPKNRDNKLQKSGVTNSFKCPHINCPEEYIEKSGRTSGDRFKEHLRAPFPIHHHSHSTGHPVSPECFTIVDRKSLGTKRRPCVFVLMILHLIGTWENTNSHTYGMKCCRTHHHSSTHNIASPPPTWPNPHKFTIQQIGGTHNFN